jgi:protein TonB
MGKPRASRSPARSARPPAPGPRAAAVTITAPRIRDPLSLALIASLLLHAIVLFIRFAPPMPIVMNPNDSRLDVVLLNAQTQSRPVKADVLAQVNQEAGGEHDSGRARSPLPAQSLARDGTDLQQQRRRLEELEAQQRELLTTAKGPATPLTPERTRETPPQPQAADRDTTEAALSRMQAEIDRNIEDYNKRPRRLTFGVNAVGVQYARYVADWASRIEKIGTERFPTEARGQQYDSLIITVEIDKHGNVLDVTINRKSKFEALNRVVRQIVYAGQPYERFPPEMAKEGDILQIVRTWTFTNDGLETRTLRGDR